MHGGPKKELVQIPKLHSKDAILILRLMSKSSELNVNLLWDNFYYWSPVGFLNLYSCTTVLQFPYPYNGHYSNVSSLAKHELAKQGEEAEGKERYNKPL